MTISLQSGQTTLNVNLTLKNPLDLSTPNDSLAMKLLDTWTNGVGANQINQVWHDNRSIASGGNDDLDLAGGLTGAFGQTITFARIKVLAIFNKSDDNVLEIGAAGTNPLSTLFADTTDKIIIRPGGGILLVAPDATGYAVTGGSADVLRVADDGVQSGSAQYDIAIGGCTS